MKKIYAILFCFLDILFFAKYLHVVPTNVGGLDNLESNLQANIEKREELFDVNGYLERIITPLMISKDGGIVARRMDGRVVIPSDDCDMTFQQQGLLELSKFCKKREVDLIYVNYPSQCGSDERLLDEGIWSFCDKRADKLLGFARDNNIRTIDIRDLFDDGYYDKQLMFYNTDHHWTTEAGLLVARTITNQCNSRFLMNFDVSRLDSDLFNRTKYPQAWLGETGRYCSFGWTGKLDDYTLLEPVYNTHISYSVPEEEIYKEGSFECLIDKSIYKQKSIYEGPTYHYSYLFSNYGYAELHNFEPTNDIRVLYIKDSFGLVVAPFLLLTAKDVIMWDIRYNDESVMNFIENNDIDVVVIGYTEGSSIAKPRMFQFDRLKE